MNVASFVRGRFDLGRLFVVFAARIDGGRMMMGPRRMSLDQLVIVFVAEPLAS
jgi:hypothetical protein